MRLRLVLIASLLIAAAAFVLAPGWARSPGGYPSTVEAEVHDIFEIKQLVVSRLEHSSRLEAVDIGCAVPRNHADKITPDSPQRADPRRLSPASSAQRTALGAHAI